MHTSERTITNTIYQSDITPTVETGNPRQAEVIAWADAHPVTWKIVTTRRSKAFGVGSCVYIGWAQRSMESSAIIERLQTLYELATGRDVYSNPNSIFQWRARFTVQHFTDKGFTGGFFQQWDIKHQRDCLTLDYTPATLDEVIEKFCGWIDRHHDTDHITVNDKIVRTFPKQEKEHAKTAIAKAT